jgi:hypothetical protein
MNDRIGHPAEHFPHWKHRRTELADSFSTFFTKSRFIVAVDNVIFVCFIETPFPAPLLEERLSRRPYGQGEGEGNDREDNLLLLKQQDRIVVINRHYPIHILFKIKKRYHTPKPFVNYYSVGIRHNRTAVKEAATLHHRATAARGLTSSTNRGVSNAGTVL